MFSISMKTKTPIWTGDIEQKSERIRVTGIMGSLRWWTEAILRSMNYYVCDPTSDNKCPQNINNEKYYCPACLIFGATGLRRRFRLNINGGRKTFVGKPINIKPLGRNRGWFLGSGIVGEVNLFVTPLNKNFDKNSILIPLIIAINWGGIGAKNQLGYGIVKINNYPKIKLNEFTKYIDGIQGSSKLKKTNYNRFPKLSDMFFTKIQFKSTNNNWWKKVDGIVPIKNDQRIINWYETNSVPIAPAIKNWLRYSRGRILWTNNNQNNNQNNKLENYLFGNMKKKITSKINISCAYKVKDNLWEFRIWGINPEDQYKSEIDKFLNKLKEALDKKTKIPFNILLGSETKDHILKVWREFNSERDTIKQNENNINNYIQSLLNED
ncbi:MAG: type III-B CRISPR module RAMP protein Cmr1 [Promethearchaeota archaeon]